jgi:signal peptidase II
MARWLALAGVLVVLDQISKLVVLRWLAPGRTVEVTPFFNFVLVYNPGAAFSFLAQAPGWQRGLFIAIALVASAWIVFLLRRHWRETLFSFALALILGGAVGNLIDRVVYGAVVDFLDFHAAGWHWPAFNVADSAITVGAVLLVWDGFFGRRPTPGA